MQKAKIERIGFVVDKQLEDWAFNLGGSSLEMGDSSFAGWEISELKEISEKFWGLTNKHRSEKDR